MPPNTRTMAALCDANRITLLQVDAAIDAAISGWSRRPFPFNEHYGIDLTTLLTTQADAVSALTSAAIGEDERRRRMRMAILRAVPTRVAS